MVMFPGREGATLHWMLELLFLPTRVAAALMSLTRWPDRFAFALNSFVNDRHPDQPYL